ncbi:unnamed protein product [Peniophora sp. CBMAI 1063]|nr:unnamed protein product [Peniophora sp. CBMAI 1063]
MVSSNVDVLIVGAGPVGLVAALALAQNGVTIRIIDKLSTWDTIGQRGAGLMPRSLEAYNLLGVLDDFIKKGSAGGFTITAYDTDGKPLPGGARFWTPQEKTPEIPFPNGHILGQDSNCAILRTHLNALGVEAELNTEMSTYEQDEAGVDAILKVNGQEETVRSKFLLGSDGGKGITRRLAGIHFEGETKDTQAIIGDVEISSLGDGAETPDRTVLHMWNDADKNRAMLRPVPEDDKTYMLFVAGPGNLDNRRLMEDIDYLNEQMRRIAHRPELTVSKIRNIAEWRLNERVADRFRVGRVLLAGDAAHCHSPTGAQGLNSGVLDAMNIAWKLAAVVKGISPLSLLDSYQEERMPVIREMLRLTNDMANRAFKSTTMDTSAWQRPNALRQLGVHYRWSSIVRDELKEGEQNGLTSTIVEPEDVYGTDSPDRLHAGDRAPDAPELVDLKTGESTQLFKILKPTRHTILILDSTFTEAVYSLLTSYPKDSIRIVVALPQGQNAEETITNHDVYVDTQENAHRAYGSSAGVSIAIIRPDGVVGGLLKGADGVQKYFAKLFL